MAIKINGIIVSDGGGSNFELDPTLTEPGSAADAKAVGDVVSELQTNIDEVSELVSTKADTDHVHDEAVTVAGGAVLSMEDIFGEGPYTIEFTKEDDESSFVEEDPTVPAWAKEPQKPTYTAAEVGALPANTVIPSIAGLATETYADNAANQVKNDLLNGAGGAYDTLKELGDLIDTNVDAIEALEQVAISKANASDLNAHINNKSNPHEVTAEQIGLTTETWTFTLEDGSTVTKAVYVG